MKIVNNRKVEHECNNMFPRRWSPRSFTGEKIPKQDLMKMFEAGRWAPSAYNGQPWQFFYVVRGSKNWNKLFYLLAPMNQMWVKNASVLVLVSSRKKFEYNNKPNITHSFDTGASWMSIALQAKMLGYYAHGMSGFDYKKAARIVGKENNVEMCFAIGKKDSKNKLPDEMKKMETQNDRKRVKEFVKQL